MGGGGKGRLQCVAECPVIDRGLSREEREDTLKRASVPGERRASEDGRRSRVRERRAKHPVRSYTAGRFVD